MKTTNKLGLPQSIVNAVIRQEYSKGDSDISVTTLLDPPRKRILLQKHHEELTEDCSQVLYRLYGTIAHTILHKNSDGLSEKRFYMDVLGWKVSGQMDLVENKTVIDFKFTSVWSFLDGVKPEYEAQLNLYKLLAEHNDLEIEKLTIIALFRDWSANEARRSSDYSNDPVKVYDIPIWEPDKAKAFLEERVRLHQEAEKALPECSSSDKWEKPTTYAVMNGENKRATKVFENKEEAETMAKTKTSFRVETRPGEWTRCLSYCAAAPFCSSFQDWKKQQMLAGNL